MASVLQILRRIGGTKAAPATGSAGQLALWKAGAKPDDLRALYAHDGTQWVPLVDYATETLPGVAAIATQAETDALVDRTKIVTPFTLGTAIKRRLYAPGFLYVRPDGNDGNDGSADTPAKAFQSLSVAMHYAYQIDINGFTLTVKLADGTYGGLSLDTPYQGGLVIVEGNIANPNAVVIRNASGQTIQLTGGAMVRFGGVRIEAPGGNGVFLDSNAMCQVITNPVVFGPCASAMVFCNGGATFLTYAGTITVAGRANNVFSTSNGTINLSSATIAFNAGIAISGSVVDCVRGLVQITGSKFSGSCSGKRFSLSLNGVITTNGAGVNFIPGTVAGTVSTGGQYG